MSQVVACYSGQSLEIWCSWIWSVRWFVGWQAGEEEEEDRPSQETTAVQQEIRERCCNVRPQERTQFQHSVIDRHKSVNRHSAMNLSALSAYIPKHISWWYWWANKLSVGDRLVVWLVTFLHSEGNTQYSEVWQTACWIGHFNISAVPYRGSGNVLTA